MQTQTPLSSAPLSATSSYPLTNLAPKQKPVAKVNTKLKLTRSDRKWIDTLQRHPQGFETSDYLALGELNELTRRGIVELVAKNGRTSTFRLTENEKTMRVKGLKLALEDYARHTIECVPLGANRPPYLSFKVASNEHPQQPHDVRLRHDLTPISCTCKARIAECIHYRAARLHYMEETDRFCLQEDLKEAQIALNSATSNQQCDLADEIHDRIGEIEGALEALKESSIVYVRRIDRSTFETWMVGECAPVTVRYGDIPSVTSKMTVSELAVLIFSSEGSVTALERLGEHRSAETQMQAAVYWRGLLRKKRYRAVLIEGKGGFASVPSLPSSSAPSGQEVAAC